MSDVAKDVRIVNGFRAVNCGTIRKMRIGSDADCKYDVEILGKGYSPQKVNAISMYCIIDNMKVNLIVFKNYGMIYVKIEKYIDDNSVVPTERVQYPMSDLPNKYSGIAVDALRAYMLIFRGGCE